MAEYRRFEDVRIWRFIIYKNSNIGWFFCCSLIGPPHGTIITALSKKKRHLLACFLLEYFAAEHYHIYRRRISSVRRQIQPKFVTSYTYSLCGRKRRKRGAPPLHLSKKLLWRNTNIVENQRRRSYHLMEISIRRPLATYSTRRTLVNIEQKIEQKWMTWWTAC